MQLPAICQKARLALALLPCREKELMASKSGAWEAQTDSQHPVMSAAPLQLALFPSTTLFLENTRSFPSLVALWL